jgi:hypothetical protein
MKRLGLILLPIIQPSIAFASATVGFAIGDLRDAAGTPLADNTSTWAIIVSNTTDPLPGGLTDGNSLGSSNTTQIANDFNNVYLTVGNKGSYTITHVGLIASVGLLGEPGVAQDTVAFTIQTAGAVTAGKLWGLYWFPGFSNGQQLTGSYQVGGFSQSVSNAASGGSFGTTVPTDGTNESAVNFIETNYNQNVLLGGDTGLAAARFTAVAIPEPSSLVLTLLGSAALLRRRRA